MTTKTTNILKAILATLLGIGTIGVFNESDTFVPNLIGLACACALFFFFKEETCDEEI